MSDVFINIPNSGSPSWKRPVANAAALPPIGNTNGDARITLNDDSIYVWNGTSWVQVSSPASTSSITALTGDVSAVGPGSVAATVNFVGGVSAANVALGSNVANAATPLNTPNTIVKRDGSGNFAAGTITANLTGNVTGNVSGSSSSFTGSLSGDVTGTQSATVISSPIVTGKLLTGLVAGTNTPILSTDSILISLEKLQAQVSSASGSAITALTGDGTATGPGSVPFTLATVNGNVGSFGSSTSIPNFTVNAKGLITAAGSNVVIAPAGTLTGTALAANVVNSSLTSVGILTSLTVSGTISASNFSGSSSGTNTGNVTIGTANGLSLSGQVLSLGLSSTSTNGALSSTDWNTFNNKQTSGNYITALTGDATATGPGSAPITFATVNSNVGSFGNATNVGSFTVNAKGLIIAAANTPIIFPVTAVTGSGNIASSGGSTPNITFTGVLPSSNGGTGVNNLFNLTIGGTSLINGTFSGTSSGTNTGDQTITLTGDVTGSGTGTFATTLATVNGNVGTFGSSTSIPTFTVNAKGLITAASGNVVIAPAGTLTGITLASNVVNSSLTSVGILTSLTVSGTISGSNFSGSSSGTNTGDVTLAPIGSSPNANAATLTGQVLNLQPASASFPGVVTTGTQTFAGNKTFVGTISASNLSGTNTGDVTIGTANGLSLAGQVLSLALSSTSTTGALSSIDFNTFNNKQSTIIIGALDAQAANANGLALVSNVLSTQSADATHPGMVNNTTQTFSGDKTFTGNTISKNLTINGTAGTGFINYTLQSSTPATPVSGFNLYSDSTNRFSWIGTNGFTRTFDGTANTANRIYILPDVSGTIQLDTRQSNASTTVAGTVTILSTDAFSMYLVDTTVARTINLPTAASVGTRRYIFKDITGTAEAFNISIVPSGADKIENLNVTKLIQTNFGTLTLISDGASNWWLA